MYGQWCQYIKPFISLLVSDSLECECGKCMDSYCYNWSNKYVWLCGWHSLTELTQSQQWTLFIPSKKILDYYRYKNQVAIAIATLETEWLWVTEVSDSAASHLSSEWGRMRRRQGIHTLLYICIHLGLLIADFWSTMLIKNDCTAEIYMVLAFLLILNVMVVHCK